jgi:hypothetical protein
MSFGMCALLLLVIISFNNSNDSSSIVSVMAVRDWYVSATHGHDKGSGTEEDPFATLSKAVASVDDFDRIMVCQGCKKDIRGLVLLKTLNRNARHFLRSIILH